MNAHFGSRKKRYRNSHKRGLTVCQAGTVPGNGRIESLLRRCGKLVFEEGFFDVKFVDLFIYTL